MQKLFLLFACLFLAVPCVAETIYVDDEGPADFNNIQAAIVRRTVYIYLEVRFLTGVWKAP